MTDYARGIEQATALYKEVIQGCEFENAKLRELLAELYEEQCDECDRWKYRDRMRELGVEV
jgi:hypothetical protein